MTAGVLFQHSITCEDYKQNGMEATLTRNIHPDVCSMVPNM